MSKRLLLLNVECHFSPIESAPSNRGVLCENYMKNMPRKKQLQGKRDKSPAKEIEIIDLDNLEVSSSPRKKARTLTRPNRVTTSCAKKSSEGSGLQFGSKSSAANPSETVDVVEVVAKEAKERPEGISESAAADPKPMVHYGFNDRLGGKLAPGYSEKTLATEEISRSRVMKCH